MKIVMLYHPDSEQEGQVLDFKRDFEMQHDGVIHLVSLETQEGADMAKLYDITQYPAILCIQDNGSLQQGWQGPELPLMGEVAAYSF